MSGDGGAAPPRVNGGLGKAREDLCAAPEAAKLSMAYSDAVRNHSDLREGSMIASQPRGKRVAVLIPEAEWTNLAAAICAITGGEVV